MVLTIDDLSVVSRVPHGARNARTPTPSASVTASSTPPIACFYRRVCGPWVSTASWRRPTRRRRRSISTSAPRTSSWLVPRAPNRGRPREHRGVPRRHSAVTTALQVFRLVVEWAESKDFRGCPLQHTVSELTDAAHPARAIVTVSESGSRSVFREWTMAAGVKDPKATARALVVLFDGAVAGSEVDGPQRASDARWMVKKLLAG